MRDVSVMVNGKLQGLPVKDVKKLVLSAFEKAESTGESKMEFESRFEKHTIVIKKGGIMLLSQTGGKVEKPLKPFNIYRHGPKSVVSIIIWNVFMNPNYDDDKYEVFEPKGIPGKFEKLDKECKAANSKIYNEEYKRDYPVQYAELKKKYPERYTE